MPLNILHIDSSGRYEGSHSRTLTANIVSSLTRRNPDAKVVARDVAHGVDFVDQAWIGAAYTPADERTEAQAARLANSDRLVAEIEAADVLVIGVPIYNFGIPAALKAWVDQVCRANLTFQYTEDGPIGLVKGKKAYVAVVSGGTKAHSEVDFAAGHIHQVLRFIGIEDIETVYADQLMIEGETKANAAYAEFDEGLAQAA